MKKLPANWKPMLLGLLGVVQAVYQGLNEPTLQAAIQDPKFYSSALFAVAMFFVKGHNVTGGTVGQPSSNQALHDANQEPHAGNPPKS
jgi:hypothetical protein